MKLSDDELRDIIDGLDRECWQCGGERCFNDAPCNMCEGVGTVLNVAGRHLLAFIARHQVELESLKEILRRKSA